MLPVAHIVESTWSSNGAIIEKLKNKLEKLGWIGRGIMLYALRR
jgi:hypothetical protein